MFDHEGGGNQLRLCLEINTTGNDDQVNKSELDELSFACLYVGLSVGVSVALSL